MKESKCHYCGQPLPITRLGVRMTGLKARIYDLVMRAGEDGITGRDLFDIVFSNDHSYNTLKAHIWQINDLIEDEGYRIKGRGTYRLVKT